MGMEENDVEKNNIDDKIREIANSELETYINPQSAGASVIKNEPSLQETLNPKPSEAPKIPVKPIIRTYKSDMEETIQAGHLSSINMAISESTRMIKQVKEDEHALKKVKINKNIVVISLVLIVGGAAALLIPYALVQKQTAPKAANPANAISDQSVMTTDLEETINLQDINANGIDLTLNQRVNESSTALGQVKDIILTQGSGASEAPITSTEFLSLINADVPPEIARNLLPQYMFGMYNYNGNQEFLILKVNSYDTTFSGMLSWETDLWQNFKNLFGLSDTDASAVSTVTDTSTTSVSASDTSADTQDSNDGNQSTFGIDVKKFQDAEFDNKDCRVVKDANGNIVFLYSIIDANTIVIATSVDTLKEIVSRIASTDTVTQ